MYKTFVQLENEWGEKEPAVTCPDGSTLECCEAEHLASRNEEIQSMAVCLDAGHL